MDYGKSEPNGHLPALCARLEGCAQCRRAAWDLSATRRLELMLAYRRRAAPLSLRCASIGPSPGAHDGNWQKPPLEKANSVLSNVRFWHIADVQPALTNVCFEGKNGHDADVTRFLV